ncbi:Acetophenone carboxylase gamma subunit [Fervidicola ferrireducens]|uniref:Acetophenone carboxylase gamma subunit n=1 Tax=Fervidicola ferrireducens TaxID=520764 RepID=A0A140L857_9FIRM|nr:Acetophenone carboxylase gamma subunit [Fervidicola ferrireducens]
MRGGKEYDGRDIVPLDEEAIRQACGKIAGKVDSIAITGVFSPMIPDQEERAAEIIREELGDIPITLSNHIASISLLERENSTILNASVITVMRKAVDALKKAVRERGIDAPLFIVQNDGTVMSADYAVNYPIFTVASGGQFSLYKAKQSITLLGTHCADPNEHYTVGADGYLHHRLASPAPLLNRGDPYSPGFRPLAARLLPSVFRPSSFSPKAHTGRGSYPACPPPLNPHHRVLPDSREVRQGRAAGLKR